MRNSTFLSALGVCLLGICFETVSAADAPAVKDTMAYRPVQKDVEYETPTADEYSKCNVKVERSGKNSGWVVTGPAGQPVRRFIDTNGDNYVDQWRYYNHGLEVYRDIDSDFNNKVDQSRWLNTGGSRWGVDQNEDGRIDSWKTLSAEEATRVAIYALVQKDTRLLQTVMLGKDDIAALGISKEYSGKLLAATGQLDSKIRSVSSSSPAVTSETKWMRFDSSMPSVIPADAGTAKTDLMVYENAMAIVETRGKTELLQVGEMVRVGDVWKLTQVPRTLEDNQVTEGGILMQPSLAANTAGALVGDITPEIQKLLEELQKLDQNSPSPTAGRDALARYNKSRTEILEKLVEASHTDEERDQWRRQLIDGLTAAVQTGEFPEGINQLQSIERDMIRNELDSDLLPYVFYRRMLAEYTKDLRLATAEKRADVQKTWHKNLDTFVTRWPDAEDVPEAMQHLAIGQEFGGEIDEARKWYQTLARKHSSTTAGIRAAGALRRLDIVGKPLTLSAAGLSGGSVDVSRYRGKVVLLFFWSTWCQPCTEDLPRMRAIYNENRSRGFEIVGVNLDTTIDPVRPFLAEHDVPWPQIFEPGGLESDPAKQFGIISLPTMFLTDKTGKVTHRNVSVDDLKTLLPELLGKP